MAQRTQVTLVDDLDGSKATQTVTFAYQGASYEIDLNDEHASSLEQALTEWIGAARKTTRGRSGSGGPTPRTGGGGVGSAAKRTDLDAVRSWARENGYTVSDRGRVSHKILEAYDAR